MWNCKLQHDLQPSFPVGISHKSHVSSFLSPEPLADLDFSIIHVQLVVICISIGFILFVTVLHVVGKVSICASPVLQSVHDQSVSLSHMFLICWSVSSYHYWPMIKQ